MLEDATAGHKLNHAGQNFAGISLMKKFRLTGILSRISGQDFNLPFFTRREQLQIK